MMSMKQWLALLCLHISYLFFGASIFYHIENPLENANLLEERKERAEILQLLQDNYAPLDPVAFDELKEKLAIYCGKEMNNISLEEERPVRWDFYHSFFFSYTVVSTIGYGNIAPTTSMGRIIMIFYALFGIPMTGILIANLGEYFGKTFRAIYEKYKKKNPTSGDNIDYQFSKIGLFGRIVLYLSPGILIFIFLPAFLFVIFEDWDYTLAVYYAFVTLTTIGFGDYVATFQPNDYGTYFIVYKIFLIFWITFGLGYLVMVIGFLTQGLRSKKVHELEKKLVHNLKATHSKIWNGVTKDVSYLRRILNEVILMKVQAVYKDEVPVSIIHRSSSCPSLDFGREHSPPPRKRALSESPGLLNYPRAQSESDLLAINKEETFAGTTCNEPAALLAKVVGALGNFTNETEMDGGIHGFTDEEILASERHGSGWSIGGEKIYATPPKYPRQRAVSEIKAPYRRSIDRPVDRFHNNNEWTWTGAAPPMRLQLQDGIKSRRYGKLSMPSVPTMNNSKSISQTQVSEESSGSTFLAPFRPLKRKMSRFFENQKSKNRSQTKLNDSLSPAEYLKKTARGRTSMMPTYLHDRDDRNRRPSLPPENIDVLEQTTIADLIRALTELHSTPPPPPKRKLGSATVTPPKMPSLTSLIPDSARQSRRFSVLPTSLTERRPSSGSTLGLPPAAVRRRFSLRVSSQDSPPFTPVLSPLARDANNRRRSSVLIPPPYSPNPPIPTIVVPESDPDNQRRRYAPFTRRMSTRESPISRFKRQPTRDIPEASAPQRRPANLEVKINISPPDDNEISKL